MTIYFSLLASFAVYSYSLVDPNLTLINSATWTEFRNIMVQLGYYHRNFSFTIYMLLIVGCFIFHFYFIKKKISPMKLGLIIAGVLFFSYPFLSHDLFNYLFDAKIVTVYGKNPYLFKGLDFPDDPWLRFMHWTHRTYPYGPVFLPITLLPSVFSFGKFILSFFFFKAFFSAFYLGAIYFLNKLKPQWAILFATHPIIIVEGLINSHNDIVATGLAIIGIYYLLKKNNNILGKALLLLSGGIKYMTLPLVLLTKNKKDRLNYIAVLGLTYLITYVCFTVVIQPWYFINMFTAIPYFEKIITKSYIFSFGLLISYYPFIVLGGWDKPEKVHMKIYIIIFFAVLNISYLLFNNRFKKIVQPLFN